MIHEVKKGKNTRMSFSRIEEKVEMPDLIDVQKQSYNWFLKSGLQDVLRDASPIKDFSGNLMIEFVDYRLEEETKYTIDEAKTRNTTYSSRLQVKVRLINKETGEIKEQEIFFGDLPLMTENGTFLINGAERVVVSQLVRSPGVYYTKERDKTGNFLYSATVIPNRGTWLEYETDSANMIWARVDRTRKVSMTTLIRALGFDTDDSINKLFEDEYLTDTLNKDTAKTTNDALIEIYKKLRPGEPLQVDAARSLLYGLLFEARRYDLARVGRYKYNLKLDIENRIVGKIAYSSIVNSDGEVIVNKDEVISEEKASLIKNSGINTVYLNIDGKKVKIIGNNTVNISKYLGYEVDKDIIKEN
ncbi:MAG: DNA-directed RNA polymerase subunit beta, partial [Clostridia bacterium]